MNLKVPAPLDPGFMPLSLVFRNFESAVKQVGGEPLTIGLERNGGLTSIFTLEVFRDGTGHDEENYAFIERVVKTLLWTRGGYKIIIAGSPLIADRIRSAFAVGGARDFDRAFMSDVYEAAFEVIHVPFDQAPVASESAAPASARLTLRFSRAIASIEAARRKLSVTTRSGMALTASPPLVMMGWKRMWSASGKVSRTQLAACIPQLAAYRALTPRWGEPPA